MNQFQLSTLLAKLPQKCQILAFSATFSKSVLKVMKQVIMNNALLLKGEEEKEDEGNKLINIEQLYHQISKEEDKVDLMLKLIESFVKESDQQLIIFYKNKTSGSLLQQAIQKYLKLESIVIHGSMSQEERNMLFDQMRVMKIKLILSTNLLSRGVDLPEVALVINYDAPDQWQDYLHRIGRAGRFGLQGIALTLVNKEEPNIFAREDVIDIEEEEDLLDFLKEKFKEVKEDYEGIERK